MAMNQHVHLSWGILTPKEELSSAQGRYKCWEQLKKILPTALKDYPNETVVCITKQGHYVLGSENSDIFELYDALKEKSPQDYLGALFRLREARRWLSMEQ